jgi:hypothetical protein
MAIQMGAPELRALELYPVTDDPFKAGWILPNGQLLDLGRGLERQDQGDSHQWSSEMIFGARDGWQQAVDRGWIRVTQEAPRSLGFEACAPPTRAQMRAIRRAGACAEQVILDYAGPGGRWSSQDVSASPPTIARVLRELTTRARRGQELPASAELAGLRGR